MIDEEQQPGSDQSSHTQCGALGRHMRWGMTVSADARGASAWEESSAGCLFSPLPQQRPPSCRRRKLTGTWKTASIPRGRTGVRNGVGHAAESEEVLRGGARRGRPDSGRDAVLTPPTPSSAGGGREDSSGSRPEPQNGAEIRPRAERRRGKKEKEGGEERKTRAFLWSDTTEARV